MNRRKTLSALGIITAGLISLKFKSSKTFVSILSKRWQASKLYTLEVIRTMPSEFIEYSPSDEQMTFAQHFIHLSYFNTLFLAVADDEKGTDDFKDLMQMNGIMEVPDDINKFKNDNLSERPSEDNKKIVLDYVNATFDYVINSINKSDDEFLEKGQNKAKVGVFQGHTNLDMILRGEMHTAHHRAQAIGYMRVKSISPPSFAEFNKL